MSNIISLKNITIKELGPSIISTTNILSQTKYSYIDFSNGDSFQNVVVPHVLGGILDNSLQEGVPTDLYFRKMGKTKFLFAGKKNDGRHLAMNPSQGSFALKFFFFLFMLLNIGIVVGGIYFILILTALPTFLLWKGISINKELNSFIKNLPNHQILG